MVYSTKKQNNNQKVEDLQNKLDRYNRIFESAKECTINNKYNSIAGSQSYSVRKEQELDISLKINTFKNSIDELNERINR